MQTRFYKCLKLMRLFQGDSAFFPSVVRSVLLFSSLSLASCATSGTSSADPFETRLMSLEKRAMYARAHKVQAEQDAIRLANASFVDVQLPEPDYSDGPDVVSSQGKVASRKGVPIGKVSAN